MQVMLIDHDECVRESFQMLLDSPQFSFLFFESASGGLEYLDENEVHVVVSDYFLPDINGVELLKTVAQKKPHIVRILMTTIVNDELIREIASAGIDMFLEKPLRVASLDTILFELKKNMKIL